MQCLVKVHFIFLIFLCFKGVLLCSFTKSWFCFGGVLEQDAWWFENSIILHIIYIITIPFSPAWHKGSISSGFDEGPPSEKRNVLWLVSCPSALWLANSLYGVSVLPRPLPKQQVRQYCHINSDPENIEQEDRAEPLHARHSKVVTLIFWLNLVLDRMSTTLRNNCIYYVQISCRRDLF